MNNPLISVIMPTYNSENTIGTALRSIQQQTFHDYEILVVDGGSIDATREIAIKSGCTVINNSKKLPEYAKHLGLLAAKGKYAVFLDSDEEILEKDAWSKKIDFLVSHVTVKNISSSGLLNPKEYPMINDYCNRIGDPFSYFMNGVDGGNTVASLRNKYDISFEDENFIIFEFRNNDVLPICDGGGHFFDLDYLKSICDISDYRVVSQVFNLMGSQTRQLGFLKSDFVRHYSNTEISSYLKKIKRRIVGNIHYCDDAPVGYSSRGSQHPWWYKIKQFLFLPYSFSCIGPCIKSIVLSIKYKDSFYLYHSYFTVYTAYWIVIEYIKKLLGLKTVYGSYGK